MDFLIKYQFFFDLLDLFFLQHLKIQRFTFRKIDVFEKLRHCTPVELLDSGNNSQTILIRIFLDLDLHIILWFCFLHLFHCRLFVFLLNSTIIFYLLIWTLFALWWFAFIVYGFFQILFLSLLNFLYLYFVFWICLLFRVRLDAFFW